MADDRQSEVDVGTTVHNRHISQTLGLRSPLLQTGHVFGITTHLNAPETHVSGWMIYTSPSRMEIGGHVPGYEEGDLLGEGLLEPGQTPAQGDAIGRDPGHIDRLQVVPGRDVVEIVGPETHGICAGHCGTMSRPCPKWAGHGFLRCHDCEELDVAVAKRDQPVGRPVSRMPPTFDRDDTMLLLEAFGSSVEIGHTDDDVVEMETHGPDDAIRVVQSAT